jgi:hypothetical protein
MSAAVALARTILLCGRVVPDASPEAIVQALTSTHAAIIVDEANLASGACQSAVVTFAQLVMQMGGSVRLVGPDAPLFGAQPPWIGDRLGAVLEELATEAVPGVSFAFAAEAEPYDVVFVFGDSPCRAESGWRVTASRWRGSIQPIGEPGTRWTGEFPIGGLAAATLAAAETFKSAMRALGPVGPHVAELALAVRASVALAEGDAPVPASLGRVDCVSGGAIVQAALHALMRAPGLTASVRVIEPERFDLTNVNRYALGRRSQVDMLKTAILSGCSTRLFTIVGQPVRFEAGTKSALLPFAPIVIVGTDTIPSRWAVQSEHPQWLVVGATSEFMAMASEHDGSEGCAGCVHPVDDGVHVDIPTVSFVSYWAGLLVATRVLLRTASAATAESRKVVELSGLRLDGPWSQVRYVNARSSRCPLAAIHAT